MKNLNEKDTIIQKIDHLSELVTSLSSSKRWLRTKEAAKYLGVSESQVHYLRASGVINCTKLSGTNYYDKYQIDELLLAGLKDE